MYNSYMYKVQQTFWMHPLKIMILFAWSWNTNIIYSEVNNKISLRPCWLLLYTFDVPVIESPTAVAVQNYTQLDDPGLHFYFHHNNADKAVQLYLINFNLEFCSFTLHFILHIFFTFCCCCCFIGKSTIDKLLLPKVVHLMVK